MTLGELMAHIAVAAKALQKQNPEMTFEEFHAIPVAIYDHDHDFTHGLQRVSIVNDDGDRVFGTGGRLLKLEICASILPAEKTT